MSIQQSTPTPRERIQEARRREAKAAAVRRRTVITASAVAALVLVGGTTLAITTASPGTPPPASAPLATPAGASGPDGTVVVYGRTDAPHTLAVYEDFRCPVCRQFEASAGKAVQQLADSGSYKIEYHLAAFLDDRLGGRGSQTALAAAGAALDAGVDKFKQFHDVLYANQPAEQEDGFSDVNRLLTLADQVPGLRTDAFTKAVTDGTYRPWADRVAAAFEHSGVRGTPTIALDGKQLNLFNQDGSPLSGDQFTALVRTKLGG